MSKTKTTEKFKEEVFELVGNEYIVTSEYTGCKNKVKFIHNIKECMNEFDMRPDCFLGGQRCPVCMKKTSIDKLRKSTDQFKKEVFELVGDEYIVLGEYINNKEKIHMLHNVGLCMHEFNMRPSAFLSGDRCPECGRISKMKTSEEFKNEVFELTNDEYLVLEEYNGCNKKIKFLHNIKNCMCEFDMRPDVFLHGGRCPRCLRELKSKKLSKNRLALVKTTEKFKEEVFDLVGDEYQVLGEYISSDTKIKFLHNIDSCMCEFYMKPNSFLQGNRCSSDTCKHHRRIEKIKADHKIKNVDFVRKVKQIWGNEFVPLEDYNGASNNIRFMHNICGTIYETTPDRIYHSFTCPNSDCRHKYFSDARKETHEDFLKKFNEKSKGEYELLSEYISSTDKCTFKHVKCGTVFEMRPTNFLSGQRCPCYRNKSKGEINLASVLEKYHIIYEPQKTFDDLKGTGGKLLSYDFYLPKYNLLIELQGQQHEKPIEIWGGKERFEQQQEHDKRKSNYAKLNKINLLEIWYWDFDNTEEILLNYLENMCEKIS